MNKHVALTVIAVLLGYQFVAYAQDSFIVPPQQQQQQRFIPQQTAAEPVVSQPAEVRSEFKTALINGIQEARKSGKINFRDATKLRVACISPAFVQSAQDLAVTQLAFSGEASEYIPTSEDGMIQVEGINWEGLTAFIEALIPLLLKLLQVFGL